PRSSGGGAAVRGLGRLLAFLVGHPAQDVAGLAVQGAADRVQRGEPDRLGPPVLQHGDVGGRDADGGRELADRQAALGEQHVEIDDDRHQTTSAISVCRSVALRSRPRITVTSIANAVPTPTAAVAAPSAPMSSMPSRGEGISATSRCTVTPSASSVAATEAPMMVSTQRKALGVKIASRLTMSSSIHTATSATWTQATPRIATAT